MEEDKVKEVVLKKGLIFSEKSEPRFNGLK
jgi:hypothetical protein